MAPKNIVVLDDHSLYRYALSILLNEYYASININQFSESKSALKYILDCKKEKQVIHLIITDQNHPGDDGIAFANACRKIEKQYNAITPLLLFSMTVRVSDQRNIFFNNNISTDNPFNLCLPKSIEKDKLIDCISELMTNSII